MDPQLVFEVLILAFPKQYKWSEETKKLLKALNWDTAKQRKEVKKPVYDPFDELEFELIDKKSTFFTAELVEKHLKLGGWRRYNSKTARAKYNNDTRKMREERD